MSIYNSKFNKTNGYVRILLAIGTSVQCYNLNLNVDNNNKISNNDEFKAKNEKLIEHEYNYKSNNTSLNND